MTHLVVGLILFACFLLRAAAPRLVSRLARHLRRRTAAIRNIELMASAARGAVTAWLLYLVTFVPFDYDLALTPWHMGLFGGGLITLYVTASILRVCHIARILPTPLDEVGSGALVLFLRSFASDDLVDDADFFMGSRSRSEDEQLALAIQAAELGQFVALGRPGAAFHGPGPDRLDIGTHDWRDVVSELLSRAAVVVMRVGTSSSMCWELDRIVEAGKVERTLFLLPYFGSEEARCEAYLQFYYTVSEAGPHFPRFPSSVPSDARAMFFDHDGEPQMITEPTPVRDISRRLKPFFARIGVEPPRLRVDADLALEMVVRGCAVCYGYAYLAAFD